MNQQLALLELEQLAVDHEVYRCSRLAIGTDHVVEQKRKPAVCAQPARQEPCLTLADLSVDRFTVIASSRVSGTGYTEWEYLLDKVVIHEARMRNEIITGQRRIADGVFELRAKLRRGVRV